MSVLCQPSMHSKHCALQASDCVCMANVIVKRYLPYHISQVAKLWCLPLLSPGFFLEIKVVFFSVQCNALALLMTDSVLSKEDISVSGLMFCHTIFQLLFAGGVVLEEECLSL